MERHAYWLLREGVRPALVAPLAVDRDVPCPLVVLDAVLGTPAEHAVIGTGRQAVVQDQDVLNALDGIRPSPTAGVTGIYDRRELRPRAASDDPIGGQAVILLKFLHSRFGCAAKDSILMNSLIRHKAVQHVLRKLHILATGTVLD